MGTYNKGILGPFSGKVGTVVGANWRGKDVMRSLPKKSSTPPSESQMLQRDKFTTCSDFLTPMSPVLSLYFGPGNTEQTRRNQAMSYHMKEAISYVAPAFEILYNKVLISKGDLLGIQSPTVTSPLANEVKFTWDNNSGQGSAKPTDKFVVVLYAPSVDTYFINMEASTRVTGGTTLTLPTIFSAQEAQCWATFVAEDNKSYATSNYLGTVVVL